MIAFNFS